MAKKKEEKTVLTRAQKTEATKGLIKEVLAVKLLRHNELIDEVSKIYVERYEGADTENINDVKGRVGSVLDIMKKESEVMSDGGTYALKARLPVPRPQKEVKEVPATEAPVAEEKPAPKKRTRAKKVAEKAEETPAPVVEEKQVEEKPAPKKRTRAKKVAEKAEELPAPVPVAEEQKAEEKPAPKKRTRAKKTVAKTEETPAPVKEEQTPAPVEEKKEIAPVEEKKAEPEKTERVEEPKAELVVKPTAEVARQNVVMDMSFLFGDKASKAVPQKREEKVEPKAQKPVEVKEEKPAKKTVTTPAPAVKEAKIAPTPAPKKEEAKPAAQKRTARGKARVEDRPMTADEKLRESFLKKLRTLGGDYFEYYSVYLLERYSMKNGRRLEGLRISGGDHDGGIDGEIELTDKLGFKETIYIQSKNWDPDKGRGESWVVGETLLQQFIGACACRQAKDGKQSCRGIFMTTSRFTPEAKRILDDMSDKIVGYDGEDIYEAAKECGFGLVKKNGEWALDENLLSGSKAFFQML